MRQQSQIEGASPRSKANAESDVLCNCVECWRTLGHRQKSQNCVVVAAVFALVAFVNYTFFFSALAACDAQAP